MKYNTTNRRLLLSPNHSSSWLFNPSAMLYYDKIEIFQEDYNQINAHKGNSSYHDAIFRNQELLIQNESLIVIGNSKKSNFHPEKEQVSELLLELLERADDDDDPLSALDLLECIKISFNAWSNLNGKKMDFLKDTEDYHKYLKGKLVPILNEKNRILNMTYSEKQALELLHNNDSIISSLSRLISISKANILLVEDGNNIYDPLLSSYMPMIKLLVCHNILSKVDNVPNNIYDIFHIINVALGKFQQIEAPQLSLSDITKAAKRCRIIRERMQELDNTLKNLNNERLVNSFSEVKSEISRILNEMQTAANRAKYYAWFLGLINLPLGVIFNPAISRMVEEGSILCDFLANKRGDFSGSYALIANRTAIIQKEYLNRTDYICNTNSWDDHYKSFL